MKNKGLSFLLFGLLLIFTSCGNNTIKNIPKITKSSVMEKLGEETDIIKNNTHILSWAYYKGDERWYISPIDVYKKVNVYSLMPIKNGNAGWATVGKDVAKFNLENDTITINYIADNNNHVYYDIGWKSWNTNSLIQSDIEKIRNSTVNIKWWFFKAPNGYWYIINKSGKILRFSSKLNSDGYEEYDWITIDIGNSKPIFFIENGIKKVKFYKDNLNQSPTVNAGEDKTVTLGDTVKLYGSGSDSDGYIISYEWKKGDEVLGTSATLEYIPTEVGTDILTLTVTDNDGATATDSVKIIVTNSKKSKAFITKWKTDNKGISSNNQITIPTKGGGYNYFIDWGDGTTNNNVNGDITHTYKKAGTYIVKISGDFPRICFGQNNINLENVKSKSGDSKKLLSIEQWGTIKWQSMEWAFYNCSNMISHAKDTPNLSNVTSMKGMFTLAEKFNQDIGNWDVSNVTNMEGMFAGAIKFNQDIGDWDVSNVTNMLGMFFKAKNFNKDIGDWDISNVTNMVAMFAEAEKFNKDIGDWDVSNVTDMEIMFLRAKNFNQDIGNWNVSNVTNMESMFENAKAFSNHDLSNWNVKKVTNHKYFSKGWGAENIEPNWKY